MIVALIVGVWTFALLLMLQREKNRACVRELRAYERGWNDGRKWEKSGDVTFAEDMIPVPRSSLKWWERL